MAVTRRRFPGPKSWALGAFFLTTTALLLYPVGSWPSFIEPNQSSRAFLTLALYERGQTHVDPEIARYCRVDDLAQYQGRHYSNKPPGSSLWLLLWTPLIDAFTPGRIRLFELVHYGRILGILLPLLGFLYVFGRFLEKHCGFAPAWGLVALYALGTNAGMYATVYFGHDLAAVALGAALLLACRTGHASGFWSGMLAGSAVITELQCLWVFPFLAALASRSAPAGQRVRRLVAFLAGAVPMGVTLLCYNWVCFGDPLTFAYKYEINRFTSKVYSATFYAMKAPDPTALYGMLLSPSRGLFVYSPWLAALAGWIFVFPKVTDPADRRTAAVCLAAPLAVILSLSGYRFWNGGFSFGMRYLVIVYPFLVTALALLWKHAGPSQRTILGLVLAAGGTLAWTLHSVGSWIFPFSPSLFADIQFNPLRVFVWPMLQKGYASCTLATLAGWKVRDSLALFACLQAVSAAAVAALVWVSCSRAARLRITAAALAGLLLFGAWLQYGQWQDTAGRKQIRKWLLTRVAYHDRYARRPLVGI